MPALDDVATYPADDRYYSASEPHFTSASSMPAAKPKFGRKTLGERPAPRRVTGRIQPASREDRLLRLMLAETQSWDAMMDEVIDHYARLIDESRREAALTA